MTSFLHDIIPSRHHSFILLVWLQNRVEYVTEESVAQYSIHDVVLPLPGYDVLYPRNKGRHAVPKVLSSVLQEQDCTLSHSLPPVGEQYHRLLEEDGFSVENLRHRVK